MGLVRKVLLIAGSAALIPLAGCGSWNAAHNYNAPTPVRTWQPVNGWLRIETPGNWPSMVFACRGADGIYESMDTSSSPEVVRDDPNCLAGIHIMPAIKHHA